MKKNLSTLIVSFFCLNTLNAQILIDFKDRPKPEPTFNFRKISANQNFIYNLGVKDKGEESIYYIEKYNAKTLDLVYQKDIKICEDDKDALVHPLFVPPVCFESNNQLVVFYCSYNEKEKTVNINVKTVNENGDAISKTRILISSKDIEVTLRGMYYNTIGYDKPVIEFTLSEDKKTILIEIDSPKFKKIYSYNIWDLLTGKITQNEVDLLSLVEKEKISINKCFLINNTLCFSYTKTNKDNTTDFGVATFDNGNKTFELKSLSLTVNTVFSVNYSINQSTNEIFISGYLRYPIDKKKPISTENLKVKLFNACFNLKSVSFKNKNEFEFKPEIARIISVPKENYDFIDKKHTPDQYLESIALIESDNYYYNISQLLFARGSVTGRFEPTYPGFEKFYANGVRTSSRDVLVTKFDKVGKLINQYLLPRASQFDAFVGSRSGALVGFANRQRNINYNLINDELHVFYLDAKKNEFKPIETYNPNDIKICDIKNGNLVHFTIKNGKVEKEVLLTEHTNSFFYSNQNMINNDAVIVDLETDKKNSQIGRLIFK